MSTEPGPKIGIAVTATCDLPPDFLKRFAMPVLPVRIRHGESQLLDRRDPDQTEAFYRHQTARRELHGESEPLSPAEVAQFLEREVIQHYPNVLLITINSQRSQIYANCVRANTEHGARFKALRREEGRFELFRMQVLDSESMFTGEAVLAWEAVRMTRDPQLIMSDLTSRLSELRKGLVAYMVPKDLYFLHARSSAKGDRSVGWFSYKLGSMLDMKPVVRCLNGETEPVERVSGFDKALDSVFERARAAIDQGLRIPYVAISIAGNLEEFRSHRGYRDFIIYARNHEIYTSLALMSATSAMNVGPGAFSLAYAT